MRRVRVLPFLFLLAAALGHTAVVKTLDLDGLAAESDTIVHGRIVASRVEWNSAHTSILTLYTVEADQYLKGFLGAKFELAEPGGEVDGLVMSVPGAPEFRVGEEAVLFIWTDDVYGRHQVDGFEQGAFRVQKDPVTGMKWVSRTAPLRAGAPAGGVAEARAATEGPPAGRTARELTQFLAQVSQAVARVAAAQKAEVQQ